MKQKDKIRKYTGKKKARATASKFFFGNTINIIFIYLFDYFIGKNLKATLRLDSEF